MIFNLNPILCVGFLPVLFGSSLCLPFRRHGQLLSLERLLERLSVHWNRFARIVSSPPRFDVCLVVVEFASSQPYKHLFVPLEQSLLRPCRNVGVVLVEQRLNSSNKVVDDAQSIRYIPFFENDNISRSFTSRSGDRSGIKTRMRPHSFHNLLSFPSRACPGASSCHLVGLLSLPIPARASSPRWRAAAYACTALGGTSGQRRSRPRHRCPSSALP